MVLITHRTSIVGIADTLMVLREGTVHMHGPRQQVLQALQEAAQKQALTPQQVATNQEVHRG